MDPTGWWWSFFYHFFKFVSMHPPRAPNMWRSQIFQHWTEIKARKGSTMPLGGATGLSFPVKWPILYSSSPSGTPFNPAPSSTPCRWPSIRYTQSGELWQHGDQRIHWKQLHLFTWKVSDLRCVSFHFEWTPLLGPKHQNLVGGSWGIFFR